VKFTTLLHYVTPHRGTLFKIVLLLLASSAFSLANPWMAGQLTAEVLNEPHFLAFSVGQILLIWLAIMTVRSTLGFLSAFLLGTTGELIATNLRSRVFEHLQALPLPCYQQRKPGDLLTLLSNDAQILSNFVTGTLVQLLPLVITFLGALGMMAWLDPVIALTAAVLLPIYYLAMKIIGRKIRPLTSNWIESWSSMVSLVQENLGLFPALKAFSRESFEAKRFDARNTHFLSLSRKRILIQSVLSPAVSLLAGMGLILLLMIGFNRMETGQLETSQLVSLLLYAVMLTQPLSGLANVYGQVMWTRGAADRLLDFFAIQPEPFSDSKPGLTGVRGDIEFQDVDFAYPGRAPVLRKFNLKIAAGETIALTGPNGAGKTTLAHLLMRFIEPEAGRILIDGTDISQVNLRSLRDQIGLVAQNTLLLNGTVAENIAYGRQLANPEEMKKAAKAARADRFIEKLPDQYETVIGDQGIRLSGGQRQRLSLARTLLKDPPILILDEATSMFDPEGESGFIEESHDLLEQRTVILITHRPASLALADRVLMMQPSCFELTTVSPEKFEELKACPES
jgi:ABC-type multidrug transport system fused ATPase/permease subunit